MSEKLNIGETYSLSHNDGKFTLRVDFTLWGLTEDQLVEAVNGIRKVKPDAFGSYDRNLAPWRTE